MVSGQPGIGMHTIGCVPISPGLDLRQGAARAGTGDFRFSDLGVNGLAPVPKLALRGKEGSLAAAALGVGNPSCSLPTALFVL